MTPREYALCRDRAAVVLGAFATAQRAALADESVRAQLRLTDWEEQLVTVDPGFAAASPTSRLDAFFVDEGRGLRFTEYNAETPAGAAYNDALTEVFEAMPVMREFQRTHHLRPLPARAGVLRSLLGAYEEWAGTRAKPKIAILDWREVPTYSEFLLFERYFASQGHRVQDRRPARGGVCERRAARGRLRHLAHLQARADPRARGAVRDRRRR